MTDFVASGTISLAFGSFNFVPGASGTGQFLVRVTIDPGDQVDITYADPLATLGAPAGDVSVGVFDGTTPVAFTAIPFGARIAAAGAHDVVFTVTWRPTSPTLLAGNVQVNGVVVGGADLPTSPQVVVVSGEAKARRPLRLAMVLDRSGSMAGLVGAQSKLAILQLAAKQALPLFLAADEVAVTAFDCALGPQLALSAPNAAALPATIDALTPGGATAIGDGLDAGRAQLGTIDVSHQYATLLVTDGLENCGSVFLCRAPQIADNTTIKTFVLGVGTNQNVNTPCLTDFCSRQQQGSYLALTGDPSTAPLLTTLTKYLTQMVADATNTQSASDPEGYLGTGEEHVHAFSVTEADVRVDAVTFIQAADFQITLETPDGHFVNPATAGTEYVHTDVTSRLRVWTGLLDRKIFKTLAGTWKAHLRRRPVDGAKPTEKGEKPAKYAVALERKHYHFLVNVESTLRLDVLVSQPSTEPGVTVRLSASVVEGTVGLAGAQVVARVQPSVGAAFDVVLKGKGAGGFSGSFTADFQGTYAIHFVATGKSLHGAPFRREALRSASVGPVSNDPRGEHPGQGAPGGGTQGGGTQGGGTQGGGTHGAPGTGSGHPGHDCGCQCHCHRPRRCACGG